MMTYWCSNNFMNLQQQHLVVVLSHKIPPDDLSLAGCAGWGSFVVLVYFVAGLLNICQEAAMQSYEGLPMTSSQCGTGPPASCDVETTCVSELLSWRRLCFLGTCMRVRVHVEGGCGAKKGNCIQEARKEVLACGKKRMDGGMRVMSWTENGR